MAETPLQIVNRVLREFKRFTGDGLPNAPVGAPLPVGDPQSGVHNPKKAELRGALLAPLGEATAQADAAAQSAADAESAKEAAETAAGGVQFPLSYGIAQTALTPAQREQARLNAGVDAPLRTGLVAGPGRICGVGMHQYNQIMSRTKHFAYDDMFDFQLIFANWFMGWEMGGSATHPYTEQGPGAAATVRAAIEYPEGNIILATHRVSFPGMSTTATIADGGQVTSNPIRVHIPKGAAFWVRTFMECSAGIPVQYRVSGDAQQFNKNAHVSAFGVTGVEDLTSGGDITTGSHSTGIAYGPLAIIGQTREPGVLIIGDSKTMGSYDEADASVDMGMVARSVGREHPYILAARDGEWGEEFLNSHTNRGALAQYCTHVIWAYGANDLTQDSASANTLEARAEAGVALFPDHPVFVTTIEPISASTDDWETWQNQTPVSQNPVRITYNNRVRGGEIAGAAGYFDLADAVERGRDTGLWQVPDDGTGELFTTDGLHPTPHAARYTRDQGVIPPGVFRRVTPQPPEEASIEQARSGRSRLRFITPWLLRLFVRLVAQDENNFSFVLFNLIQVCISRGVGTLTAETAVGGVYQSTGTLSWNFPVAFNGTPFWIGARPRASSRWAAISGTSGSSCTIRQFAPASNATEVETDCIAIGLYVDVGG